MCQFDHENIVKLHGVVTETPIMIVLEYMSRGDLRNLLLNLQSSLVLTDFIKSYVYMISPQQGYSSKVANCFVKILSRNSCRHGLP